MYTSILLYLRVLPVLYRPEVVDIGVNTIKRKHAICLKDYRIRSFFRFSACTWNRLGIDSSTDLDLCRHLGIDSRTDLDDRYSNLFLNAYINRHVHTENLKMIEVNSPFGMWHFFL